MSGVIFRLTLRQLLSRRRSLAVAALAFIPVVLALIARINADELDRAEWATNVLYQGFIAGTALPLVALVFGTAALGSEFEDGTAVYLLAKPISRASIVTAKMLGAWISSSVILLLSGGLSGTIILAGEGEGAVVAGFTAALAAGALVYTALFVMLSILTGRALIVGLIYVFLWEGVITGLFTGTRILSVREYTLAVSDLIAGTPDRVFEADVNGVAAIVLIAGVAAGATWYAIRALERWEMRDSG